MSVSTTDKSDSVKRCVQTHDGAYLIITRKGASGSSPIPYHEGASVLVRNGVIQKPVQ